MIARMDIRAIATEVCNSYGRRRIARDLGIAPSSTYKWDEAGIPPRRVLDVERLTGRSRHELRPDIFGPPPT